MLLPYEQRAGAQLWNVFRATHTKIYLFITLPECEIIFRAIFDLYNDCCVLLVMKMHRGIESANGCVFKKRELDEFYTQIMDLYFLGFFLLVNDTSYMKLVKRSESNNQCILYV